MDCPSDSSFFCPCLRRGGGFVFSSPSTVWNGNAQLGLYLRCVPLCSYGLYQIQRYDRRAVCLGLDFCDKQKSHQLYTEPYKEKHITKFRNTKIYIERKVAA